MWHLRSAIGVIAAVFLTVGLLHGQATKGKGTLPTYYNKLGLSEEQKEKILKIRADHKDKIADLEKQVKELKAKEKSEYESVLTADQKDRLRDIISKAAPPVDKPKDKDKSEK